MLVAAAAARPAAAEAAGKPLFGVTVAEYPNSSQLQALARGGARTLRFPLSWDSVEPTPGARQWQALDELVADAAVADISLAPFLFGSPSWMSSNPSIPPIYTAEQRTAWATFVREAAGRYGSTGSFWSERPELPRRPIVIWQVWNEVNLEFFWGSKPSPPAYAGLLKATAAALRAGDPAAQVLLAGLIPFKTTGAGNVSGPRYLQRLLRIKGVRQAIDAVAIHPYGARPGISMKWLDNTRRVLDQAGARRVPLWATEFGWSTGGVGWGKSPFRASSAQQARWVSQVMRLMKRARKGLRLARAIYFSFSDYDQPEGEDNWIARMGLFTLGGEPKRAWFSFAKAAGGQP